MACGRRILLPRMFLRPPVICGGVPGYVNVSVEHSVAGIFLGCPALQSEIAPHARRRIPISLPRPLAGEKKNAPGRHKPSAGDERRSGGALATLAEAAAATETGARDVADANRFGYASFDEHNKRVHVRDVELDHTHYAGRLKPGHAKFVPRSDCYACVPVPRSQYAWQANANNQLIFATDGAEHTCAA